MGDRGPRTDGRRRTLTTSNVQRTDSGQLGGVEKKKSLGRGRPGQDGDRTGTGPGRASFSLFPLYFPLSLSQPCAVSRAQASDPLAPGAGAGWVVLLLAGWWWATRVASQSAVV